MAELFGAWLAIFSFIGLTVIAFLFICLILELRYGYPTKKRDKKLLKIKRIEVEASGRKHCADCKFSVYDKKESYERDKWRCNHPKVINLVTKEPQSCSILRMHSLSTSEYLKRMNSVLKPPNWIDCYQEGHLWENKYK